MRRVDRPGTGQTPDARRPRRQRLLLTWLRATGSCFLLSTLLSPACAQRKPLAQLISFSVETDVNRSSEGPAVGLIRRGLPLAPGYVIRTNDAGRAELLFRDGRQAKLDINTALELSVTRSDRMRLLRGNVRLIVPPRAHWDIEAPAASAHVRGTDFHLSVAADGTTTVTVVEGEVEFENPQGRVVVTERQESKAVRGHAPRPPEAAVDLPFIIQWTNEVQPVALLLEISYVSQDPERLKAALKEVEALPQSPERWRRLGDVRHDQGKLPEALAAYQAARARTARRDARAEDVALLEARLGQTWLELGNLHEAEAAFRRGLEQSAANTEARVGLVMTLLSRRMNAAALAEARTAVEGDAASPVAQTALALALIRSGDRKQAQQSLAEALKRDPEYAQAHAWRSFLLRVDERLDEAYEAATKAVELAPFSSLARQARSDAAFALGLLREARNEADKAVALNPLSPGAHVSLGRALLQAGEIDRAVPEASQAVALDPDLERAHFFLGLVFWEQRRLERARREFQQAVALSPGYLEARAFLARVYLAQGRRALAETVAQKAVVQDPDYAPVRAALGRVYQAAGRLAEAATEYEKALQIADAEHRPTPLYHLELARVYLDQNNIPDALANGLAAVAEAPGSHEAHAVLGLIYDRKGNPEQARREYREALSFSIEDALAHIGLGTSVPTSGERVREIQRVLKGVQDISFSTADTSDSLREIAQAMLRDPTVLAEIFKPGVTTEIAPSGGNQATYALGATHRDQYSLGKLHDLSFGNWERNDNYRNGRPEMRTLGWINVAAAPNYRTQLLGQYLYLGRERALPGPISQPSPDARSSFRDNEWDLSTRYQVDRATFAWLHAAHHLSFTEDRDPDALEDRPGSEAPAVVSRTRYRQVVLEGRLDRRWGGGHTSTYVVSAGRNEPDNRKLSFTRATREFDEQQISARDQVVAHTLQHEYSPGARLSLVIGTTAERFTRRFAITEAGGATRRGGLSETRWLPYGQATYVLSRRDLVRAIAHRRHELGFISALQPSEAFLVDESRPLELEELTRNFELDYEHRFSPRIFTKLFAFRGELTNFTAEPAVNQHLNPQPPIFFNVPDARIQEIGLRYEHQIGRFLSSALRFTYREVTDQTAPSESGRQIPFNPRSRLDIGLTYIDRAGTKLFGGVIWNEGLSEGAARDEARPVPDQVVANLRLGREPSVHHEWSLTINNLFSTRTRFWPGFPAPGRTYRLQYQFRF